MYPAVCRALLVYPAVCQPNASFCGRKSKIHEIVATNLFLTIQSVNLLKARCVRLDPKKIGVNCESLKSDVKLCVQHLNQFTKFTVIQISEFLRTSVHNFCDFQNTPVHVRSISG
jgi:hypothetical protein